MPKKEIAGHTWRITRIKGSRAEVIGRVRATDDKTAIERAIEEYGITNREHQKRLVAQRVEWQVASFSDGSAAVFAVN
jgi:hypothetical protein